MSDIVSAIKNLFAKKYSLYVLMTVLLILAGLVLYLCLSGGERSDSTEHILPEYVPPTSEELARLLLSDGYLWAGELEYDGERYVFYADSANVRVLSAYGELFWGHSAFKGNTVFEWPNLQAYTPRELAVADSLYHNVWEYSSATFAGEVGYLLDKGLTVVMRARTTDYLDYVLADEKGSQFVRLFAGGGKIVKVTVDGAYMFNLEDY